MSKWYQADLWYCGCCGDGPIRDGLWCDRCRHHVSRDMWKPPHERTYEAVNGKPCPFAVTENKEITE